MCYCGRSKLWAAQDTQSPELRAPHLMLLHAHRFFLVGMAATRSPPHLGAHPKTPNRMARDPPGNPPYTAWESERNPHGAHREPSGNPAGTRMGEREEPTRSPRSPPGTHREPTGNPPQTASKKAQEPTSHPLGFIILFIRGKRDAVGNIEALSSIIQRLFL